MGMENITETIEDLKKARENFFRIQNEYATEPDIMKFYLPSAQHMVTELENHLSYLISNELDKDFQLNSNYMADLWIKFEGKQIGSGKGPIGVVGLYLQKLNTANRHAMKLIEGTKEVLGDMSNKIFDLSTFDLVATGKGSLKLGLRTPSYNELSDTEAQQLNMFETEDPLQKLSEIVQINKLSMEGFKLLIKTLESTKDEELFTELQEKYEEKEVLKLLHYAKELVPSSRAQFDSVSFEGDNLGVSSSILKTDKNTRKLIIERENLLKRDTEYISGKGWLRAVDLDELTGIIRPFKFKNKNIDKIDCHFTKETSQLLEFNSLLDEFVNITGFLQLNKNLEPNKMDVEEIFIENDLDND